MSFFGGKGKTTTTASQKAPVITRSHSTQLPIESTVGPNTYVKGDVQGDGGLRIDGIVEGNVELTGNLVITESAKVLAEIKANNVSVAGAVQGNITANRVEILETGRVWGDMTVKSLLVNEGAYFRGQTYMPQDLQPPQLEPPKSRGTAAPSAPELPKPQSVVDVEPEPPKIEKKK
ncbi:MAG: polymer-forming cytoskeletal protein [Anaerolineae bacterium]|nr:polymer-forming cytoskeletal protein [Anaerolineae bacterium]